MDELKRTVEEHDDRLHKISERVAVLEVYYSNVNSTLCEIKESIAQIHGKIDHLTEINGVQDKNLARYSALLNGQSKNTAWLMSMAASITTGIIVGAILRFLR